MRTLTRLVVAAMATASFAVPAAAAAPDVEVGLVSDIRPVGGSDPRELTHVGSVVFFSAADGTRGRELWVSDGTDAGTRLVRDINPGAAGSKPALLTRVGPRLFFTAQAFEQAGKAVVVKRFSRVGGNQLAQQVNCLVVLALTFGPLLNVSCSFPNYI